MRKTLASRTTSLLSAASRAETAVYQDSHSNFRALTNLAKASSRHRATCTYSSCQQLLLQRSVVTSGCQLFGKALGCWSNPHACAHAQQRHLITADARPACSDELSEQEYHRISDLTLANIMNKLEPIIEDGSMEEAELEYSEGVMTIDLGDHGTYVINKQAPNKQIWLSSPVSGPIRYDCKGGCWLSSRDGHDMHERLEAELSDVLGPLELEPPPSVQQGWVGYGADPT